jgi:prevent-host-death family protein
MSQPAVSMALRRMREAFDDPLFIRVPKGFLKWVQKRVRRETYNRAMKEVSIHALKAQLSSVVGAAEGGETIVITRHGKAVARLGPADPPAAGDDGARGARGRDVVGGSRRPVEAASMANRKRRLYLDTSAYFAALLDEERADVAGELHEAEVLSSVLLVIEARRNLVRMARERRLTVEHYRAAMDRIASDCQAFILRDLTLDLCEAHPVPAVATPRSLDLVHLRTAQWFHHQQPIDRFLTMDAVQRDAAREIGLPV